MSSVIAPLSNAAVFVLLLLLMSSAASVGIQATIQVNIGNELGQGSRLRVHCKSYQNDVVTADLGVHFLPTSAVYSWTFYPDITGATVFSCFVAPAGILAPPSRHVRFDAYREYGLEAPLVVDGQVYWAVKPDGVYERIFEVGEDVLFYTWDN